MTRARLRVAATTLVVAVALGACGETTDEPGPRPELPDTPAATMRVTLDRLFREYVYLLGLVTENSVTRQTKPASAAKEALEENTLAIADLFETVYGDSAEKTFLLAWRPLSVAILAYTTTKILKIPLPNVDRRFAQVAAAVGTFAKRLTALIDAGVLVERIRDLLGSLRAVVDAQVANDYVKADRALRPAADRAGDVAFRFARAFIDELPALFPGDASGAAADFRVSLEGLLVEHVYLVGYTTENVVTSQSKPRAGASAALEAGAVAFAHQVGVAFGPGAEKAFLPIWKRLGELLVAFAGSAKDTAAAARARAGLDQHVDDFTAVLTGINPLLRADVADRLIGAHVDGMVDAIQKQVSGDFDAADLGLRAAAARAEDFGAAFAAATVERLRARFSQGATAAADGVRALPRGLR